MIMSDSTAIHLLYAHQTLEELASIIQEGDGSASDEPTALKRAYTLMVQGSVAEARQLLADLVERASASRVRLWAARALRDQGLWPNGEMALLAQGVVMEVPLDTGKDVLAVYRDGTARFFSHAGAVLVYEGRDRRCDRLCQQIIAAADQVVSAPKGFALPEGSPCLTVLTLSGEIRAGTDSPLKALRLGAELIRRFSSLIRQKT